MPEQQAAPADGDKRQEGSGWSDTVRSIVQAILIFYVINFGVSKFFGSQAQGPPIPAFDAAKSTAGINQDYNPIPQAIAPIWPMNSTLDVKIYVAPSLAMPGLRHVPASHLVLDERAFRLGDWKDRRVVDTRLAVPREVQHNHTLWAHIYIALHGHELDPAAPGYDVKTAYHFFRPLNQFLPKKKVVHTRKLLGGDDQADDVVPEQEKHKGAVIASYYHPNVTMSFIPDSGMILWPKIHPAVRDHVVLETTGARDDSGQNGWYYPVLFVNTFWQLRDHMTELNSTVKTLPLRVDLANLNNWKFTLYASVDEGVKQSQRRAAEGGPVPAGGDGSEFEEFKRILVDTNVYLLGTTVVVSILHMFFEFLAFKNDVSHWRHKKDNVGVSFRTILANVVMQTIIFLYLVDNSDGTSWMILMSQGMGILVEAWKITKTVNVRVRASAPGSLIPYTVRFEDKHQLSETEKRTQEYDRIAFKYLYMVAVPLLAAYAAYSVAYETHKGWYSFVLTTLVGSVYAYGFLMMVPSLYINYRLKSVAHMPGRAMTYKVFSTFIDDLFAFTIKMPTLHRLATLRDDVIFFVYLYQYWKYKVDPTRVNEFGQGGDEDEEREKADDKKAEPPAVAEGKPAATSSGAEPGGAGAEDVKRR